MDWIELWNTKYFMKYCLELHLFYNMLRPLMATWLQISPMSRLVSADIPTINTVASVISFTCRKKETQTASICIQS